MTDRYAVIGNPVAHSLSPEIHARFAKQTQQTLTYDRVEAPIGEFGPSASAFFASGGAGINVTVPFKGDACVWVDTLDELAGEAQAVNTVALRDEKRVGYNTDGLGLVRDLAALGVMLNGASVLLVGAGGAARGVVRPLLDTGIVRLVVANRTRERALALASEIAGVEGVGVEEARGAFDIVINATSAGLVGQGDVVAPSLVVDAVCYDMLYSRDGETDFCAWARTHGARRCHDGLGMLVEQAAEAFRIWRGVLPDAREVLAMLRE
ncbi:MAG: shikimate dehydrogenase [Pseudomonadales bacterium]|jgi:shikimate dehydrogenase|nr:shikimate dehydrogenase [Pseudomonadales bacterium]MDP6471442.1 shikimate dehydrogenase [Pseudomonadales bacterium]MDP6828611.1 shikimate dehydrogenase [Pseudomonadales bacterium]MDP6973206.1 shikimate dehydrogenase [Pseudomonadales bacterium]|tara:strand:- start:33 stop:830 length:798 start_codon:yes stop_codon:yes gene_type:complete